jgi:hypothetical protein
MTEERPQSGSETPQPSHTPEVHEGPKSDVARQADRSSGGRPSNRRFDRGPDRGPRHGRGRPDHRGHHDRRPGRYRPNGRGGFHRAEDETRLREIIHKAEQQLADSAQPVQLENLNPFERKQVHKHFERRKPAIETKTYRGEGDSQVLWIFPVANLKKFAEEKANEALETGADVVLPPMSNYERFIIHDALKDNESVETISVGEGEERHIEIQPKKFGRGLKKIMKKIKLM